LKRMCDALYVERYMTLDVVNEGENASMGYMDSNDKTKIKRRTTGGVMKMCVRVTRKDVYWFWFFL